MHLIIFYFSKLMHRFQVLFYLHTWKFILFQSSINTLISKLQQSRNTLHLLVDASYWNNPSLCHSRRKWRQNELGQRGAPC
jgi:hypothetical protein